MVDAMREALYMTQHQKATNHRKSEEYVRQSTKYVFPVLICPLMLVACRG